MWSSESALVRASIDFLSQMTKGGIVRRELRHGGSGGFERSKLGVRHEKELLLHSSSGP
jgi:hypothetical protein